MGRSPSSDTTGPAMQPLGFHLIYSAYGFWLPNDPRGSWSTFVGSLRLYELFGPATKVSVRESVAHRPHNRAARLAAKRTLKYPPAVFTGPQAREVGLGIRETVEDQGLVVWACAVMPDHVHLVTARHAVPPRQIVGRCRVRASRRLHDAGLWPVDRPVWGKGSWAVALDTRDDVAARIRYVERNPTAAGLPPQRWSFVTAWA